MTTTERYMTDFTTDLHDALDLRALEDREPDYDQDPLYGEPWVVISQTILDYETEERLYWDEQRRLLSDARYDEYYG